jgi:hypothetical protein
MRSALVLDLMIDEQTSAAVAAPTLGLPERVGGSRNFDYRYAWLRDGNLTLEAMLRLGFGEAGARLADLAAARRRPQPPAAAADLPPRRAAAAGRCRARPALLPRFAPVTLGNSAQAQLQLGTYGDVFDVVWKYVEDGNALGGEVYVGVATVYTIWGTSSRPGWPAQWPRAAARPADARRRAAPLRRGPCARPCGSRPACARARP